MFGKIYEGKRVLITGHTGVKGSWLTYWLSRMGADVYGISHPPREGYNHYKLLNLTSILKKDIHSDISWMDKDEINSIRPDIVFHLAAKAIIAKTFEEPESTFFHNVMGTVHILELCRHCPSVKGIVDVVTDKVYSDMNWEWGYRENDELGGFDPYSASKVCCEHVIQSYRKSFGMNIATARAGNVIGGGDWSFKRLIPDIVRATAKGEKVVVHTPNATRPWQHVLDALYGYLLLGEKILKGEDVNRAWNFGPTGEMSVLDILTTAQIVWPEVHWEINEADTHPFMVYLLKLDSSESNKFLGWRPRWTMRASVLRTIFWYKDYYQRGFINTGGDIDAYMQSLR